MNAHLPADDRRWVVTVGASAGGVEPLCRLMQGLPADFPATVVVVLHLAAYSSSALPGILTRCGPLAAAEARDGDKLPPGEILVAPPDRHVIIDGGVVRLDEGPKENGVRPAVDVLFRTAAEELGPHVIGVVLSGTLDDGTAGLRLIGERGGIKVVQDPEDALFRSMPESAVRWADPDYVVDVAEIPDLLERLVGEPAAKPSEDEVQDMGEVHEAAGDASAADQEGEITELRCPDCGGTLWERGGEFPTFRCRVGHSYSPNALLSGQSAALEESLWAAVVALEERADLDDRMARRADAGHRHRRAARYRLDASDARRRADVIRGVIPPGGEVLDVDDAEA